MNSTIYHTFLSKISFSVDSHIFETFFKPLSFSIDENSSILSILSPNDFISDYVESNYKHLLLTISKDLGYSIKNLNFSLKSIKSTSTHLETSTPSNKKMYDNYCNLNKRFTLDTFVVGQNNQFAKSASLAISESPGKTKFNPLLIYGDVGLGKTHLLQAIGNSVLSRFPQVKVSYVSSEEFYLNFIDAIKNNSIKHFTSHFRSSDLFLMDDVQFLSGKESTQEEFFYIFNTLYQDGKQIVLTSDLPPSSLKGLQDRLISRFQWGLCVDIQPPDLETRVAILNKKAEEDHLSISKDIIYFIAENVTSNIRELEGCIIRLLAYASITKSDISINLVKNILKDSIKIDKETKLSIDKIIEKVSEYYNVPVNNIREKNRIKEVAHCRQIAMYISKNYTNHSLKTIGLNFGGRDHSTVIHAIKTIDNLKKNDISVVNDINNIVSSLQ